MHIVYVIRIRIRICKIRIRICIYVCVNIYVYVYVPWAFRPAQKQEAPHLQRRAKGERIAEDGLFNTAGEAGLFDTREGAT